MDGGSNGAISGSNKSKMAAATILETLMMIQFIKDKTRKVVNKISYKWVGLTIDGLRRVKRGDEYMWPVYTHFVKNDH